MSDGLDTFGAFRRVRLLVHRAPAELRAWLMKDSGDSYMICLRAHHPARLRVCTVQGFPDRRTEYLPHAWSMTRGPQRTASWRDPFLMATKWVYRALYPPRDGGPRDPDAPGTMRGVYATLAGLAREAAATCDPVARALVMRFQPHLRFWLYCRLVGDPSGRLAQLATVCPGSLIFAFALERSGYPTLKAASLGLLGAAIAGQRLDRMLSEAVETWAASAGERALADLEHIDPVWDRVHRAAGGAGERLLAQQQLLLRRAGPMVATTNLFLPPPISFVPEDIPRKVRDNARWFSLVKCSRLLLVSPMEEEQARVGGLSAFISRHAPAFVRRGRGLRPRTLIGCFRDYAAATNRWPARSTSGRFVDDALEWHDRMAAIKNLAELAELTPDQPLDVHTPLPEPPAGAWRHGGVEVLPVTSVGDLITEGNQMRHCVAASYGSVARGQTAIYHANVDGKPLTIEIGRHELGWRIQEARGFANREPTAAEWWALRHWEAGLG